MFFIFANQILIRMIFLITYDLNAPGKDYNPLYDKIKSLGDNFHPLESTWFLESHDTAHKISESLRTVMDENDSLFVVEITNMPRQGWLPKTAWEWLGEKK